jgi:septum formation protein
MGKNQSLNNPYPLILASTSKYRQELLAQLGLSFTSLAPDFNEDSLKNKGLHPRNLSSDLARHKAMAVFNLHPDCCVIGSDQVCVLGERIFSKPKTKENAIEQLQLLQGKSHQLITSVSIVFPDGEHTFINETSLKMRPLTEEQIFRYIDLEKPLDCAGSYKLESQGIKLFESINMSDHTAIIGLPLIELCNHLIKIGYHI